MADTRVRNAMIGITYYFAAFYASLFGSYTNLSFLD